MIASVSVFAQNPKNLDEKLFEELHGHASFNAVFVVLSVILVGILFSLWRLDRKVSNLLKEVKK
jgi:hypothetical protein